MKKLLDLEKKFRQLAKDQVKDMFAILKRNEQAILDLNREQMMQGLRADGSLMDDYSSEDYAIMKILFNPNGVRDLRLTGSFQEEMFIGEKNGKYFIDSKDSKRNKLVSENGNIFGLTERSRKIAVQKIIEPELRRYYKKRLGL